MWDSTAYCYVVKWKVNKIDVILFTWIHMPDCVYAFIWNQHNLMDIYTHMRWIIKRQGTKWNEMKSNEIRPKTSFFMNDRWNFITRAFCLFVSFVWLAFQFRCDLRFHLNVLVKWYRWHFRYEDEFYYAVMVMAKNLYGKQIHIKSSYGTYYIWTNTLSQFPWKMTKQWANRPVKPIAHSAKQRVEHERKKQNEVNK